MLPAPAPGKCRASRRASGSNSSRTKITGTRRAFPMSTRWCCCRCRRRMRAPRRLLSGQVDWIEAPAPDAVAEIKQRGFLIYSNEEPHVWPWQFSRLPGSPWNDIRVRKAANLCIDREGLRDGLLGGSDGAGDRHLRAGSSLARQPDFPDQVRQAGGAETDAGGGIWSEQAFGGQGPDLGVGLRPDAAAADERISAAGARRMLLRRAASTSSNGTRCSPTGGAAPRTRPPTAPMRST